MAKSKITVTVSSDTSGFKSGLKEAETGLSGFSNNLQSTGKSMMGFGSLMTLGITAPLALAGKAAFDAASDINESLNKVKVVFGQSSGEIDKWSKDAAKNLGLSRREALAAAGGFGDMFTQLGFTQEASGKMSKSVLQMSADLGSFSNLDTADVSDRITAAFRGEFDSLQKVIPNINAARVEKEALALSGKKLASELTAQEKAQAVLNIVEKDGAKAKGDFAKTSGDAANAQKILAAQIDDLKGKIGVGLLPIVTKGISIFSGLASAFADLSPKMQKFILIGAGIAAAIGPAITIIGALVTGVGLLLTPIGLTIGAIALVAAGFIYLYNTSEPVRKAIDGLVEAFKNFDISNIGDSLKDVGNSLGTVLSTGLDALGEAIGNIDWAEIASMLLDGLTKVKDAAFDFLGSIDWGGIVLSLGRLLGKAFESLGKLLTEIDWKKVFAFILDLGVDLIKLFLKIDWGKVAAGIGTALLGALKLVFIALPKGLIKMVVGLFSAVGDLLTGEVDWGEVAGKVGEGILKLFELVFVDLPVLIWDLAWGALKAAWNFIADVDWGEVLTTIGSAFLGLLKLVFIDLPGKIWDLAWAGLKAAWNFIKDVDWGEVAKTIGKSFLGLLKTVFIDFPSKVGELVGKGVKAAFKWAVDNGGDLIGSLTDFLKKIPSKIGDVFKGAGKWLVDTGKDIIQGLLDGAGSLLKKIGTFFLDKVPGWIKTPFKKALGISSPSKVFKEYGRNVVDGFTAGLANLAPIDAAMDRMASATTLNLAGASAAAGTTVVNNYYVDAQMLTPTPEVGRVIASSLKEYNALDGR